MKRGAGLLLAASAFSAGLVGVTPFVGASSASADEATPSIFTISASATSIAPGDSAFVSVHRSGGAEGVVSVSVDSAALPAELAAVVAPIDAEVTFLDGDTADKSIPIVFLGRGLPGDGLPDDDMTGDDHPIDDDREGDVIDDTRDDVVGTGIGTPVIGGGAAHVGASVVASGAVSRVIAAEGGSAPFTVSLSAPTGGAGLGTPSSVSISVATPPTTTPVDGGSGTSGSTTGGTTTPGTTTGTTTRNSAGTTSPVGGGQSLADTGVDAILPFIVATLAAIAGLAALLVVRRRRTPSTE